MPLQWPKKKNTSTPTPTPTPTPKPTPTSKINRVSRFVNEIRASRRGESLVVQTGFPTSVIDLIVKNRNRLNQKNKNCNISSCFGGAVELDAPRTPLAPLILNSINDPLSIQNEETGNEVCVSSFSNDVNFINEVLEDNQNQKLKIQYLNSRKNKVSFVIFMFVVLIMVMGKKKIAIAVTFSAFLLLFLEFLMKFCVNESKKLMVNTKIIGKSLIEADEEEEEEEDDNVLVSSFVDFRDEFAGLIQRRKNKEIHFDSAKDENVHELSTHDDDKKIKSLEDCEIIVVEEEKIECLKKTNSAKLRANKFKKFMAKKFGGESKLRRNRKACPVDSSNEGSDCTTEMETVMEEEQEIDQDNNDIGGGDHMIQLDGYEHIVHSNVNSVKGIQQDLGKKSWITFIPVMIILAGLVGGRVMALVLIIVWLILHKLLGATQRRLRSTNSSKNKIIQDEKSY